MTQRTCHTVGGVDAIRFILQYRDTATGEPLGARAMTVVDLAAPGDLAYVLSEEFAQPAGTAL